jgi:WD40 repeat protein
MADVEWLDADRLVVVSLDGRPRVFDVATGRSRDSAIEIQPGWSAIAQAGAGRVAFGYEDAHIDVFDFDEARRVVTLELSASPLPESGPVNQLEASADGSRMYARASLGLYEFDVDSGRQLAMYPDTSINSLAVAPEGPIAVGHISGAVTLHDLDDFSLIGTLPGSRAWAWVEYDGSGRFLAVGGGDGTIALYDVARRQRMGDPIDVGVLRIALRPDGLELAVAQRTGLMLWSLNSDRMTEAACRVAGRNLTHAEWDTYIGDLAPYRATCPDYPIPDA